MMVLKSGRCRRFLLILLLCNLITFVYISSGGQGITLKLRDLLSSPETPDLLLSLKLDDTIKFKDEGVLTDKSISLTKQDLLAQIQDKVPNLPLKYLQQANIKETTRNASCAAYPPLFDIHFNNMYWQTLRTSDGTFHLLNAFYDNRQLVKKKPVIRILGMHDRLKPKVKNHCQLWFEGVEEPVTTPVFENKFMWYKAGGNYKDGFLQPFLISCQIPAAYRKAVPQSVSLVEHQCDKATTNLRVINNRPVSEKKDFAVCVKGLDIIHEDISVKLIEWLELLFILGADKVFMYDLEVHSNISKVLDYYQTQGHVDVTKLTLPGEQPNIPGLLHLYLKNKLIHKRQNELIPYNDCLYQNIYRYKYVVLLDIDEIIIPQKAITWNKMMETVKGKSLRTKMMHSWTSYNVRNVYFMDSMQESHGFTPGIPKYMHMLQHVYRSKNYTKPGAYVKSFHDTQRVLVSHNHYPFACLIGRCSPYAVDTEDAQLQHYRTDCVADLKEVCEREFKNHTVLDTTIRKYQDLLIANVRETLINLGFLETVTANNTSNLVTPTENTQYGRQNYYASSDSEN